MRASEFVTERKSAEDIYLDALARHAKAAAKRYRREMLRQNVNLATKKLRKIGIDSHQFSTDVPVD